MKMFIMIIMLCSPLFAFAAENCTTQAGEEKVIEQKEISSDVPKFLEGATICVKLADKTESCVSSERFKVVPRQQQFIVTKTYQKRVTTCSAEQLRNRISLHAGKGPNGGLETTVGSSGATIESERGTVGAAQYQYLFSDRWSLSGQIQSSQLKNVETGLVGIGYDF